MAPPPPRSPASTFSAAAVASSMHLMLLQAAYDGDLRLFKRLVRSLDKGRGRLREAVEAARGHDGVGVLHLAAAAERLEVCRYLVEELRVDVDAVDDTGRTPLSYAIHSNNMAIVKYLLDHGADKDKVATGGLGPLHSAAGIGNCEMVELLLAKGAYIDSVALEGTPLHIAALEGQACTMKILLDHNADAGADVDEDCILTALIDAANNDSAEILNYLLEAANCNVPDDDENLNKRKVAHLKSQGSKAVQEKDYLTASGFYSEGSHGILEDISKDLGEVTFGGCCWR